MCRVSRQRHDVLGISDELELENQVVAANVV